MGLAAGSALLRDWLDNRIKRPEDIETMLGFAPGSLIPEFKPGKKNTSSNVLEEHQKRIGFQEIYCQLAVRVENDHNTHNSKTFALTSLGQNSGVSTVASELLSVIEAPHDRKLIIDLNKDSYSQLETVESQPGLDSFIAGVAKLQECITESEDTKYHVLKRDRTKGIDLNRISNPGFKGLFEELQADYDYIFIDAPSVLNSSEVQAMCQVADVSLLVVNSSSDTWDLLFRALDILEALKVSAISLIMNKVNAIYSCLPDAAALNPEWKKQFDPKAGIENSSEVPGG